MRGLNFGLLLFRILGGEVRKLLCAQGLTIDVVKYHIGLKDYPAHTHTHKSELQSEVASRFDKCFTQYGM